MSPAAIPAHQHTSMIGHLSLADMYAKEVGSLVLDSAMRTSVTGSRLLKKGARLYGCWYRTPCSRLTDVKLTGCFYVERLWKECRLRLAPAAETRDGKVPPRAIKQLKLGQPSSSSSS
jgi:hypothetical protein